MTHPNLSPASRSESAFHSCAYASEPFLSCAVLKSPTCRSRMSNAAPYASAASESLRAAASDAPFLNSASASSLRFVSIFTAAASFSPVTVLGMFSICA